MLRPATDADLSAMRAWRNQEANRAVSLTQHEISAEEHRAWWDRVTRDASHRVLIFEVEDRALGVVTFFDLANETDTKGVRRTASWGFYLDHDTVAAEGLAMIAWAKVMSEAVSYAFDELGLDVLHGEVLGHNESVRAMNRRHRFTESAPQTRVVEGREVEVLAVSLRREDRRVARRSTTTPQETR